MNYVFFFPDEMRAEALSCYGNPHISTPHYDRLANEGVLFDQCHVQNPVCSPSRCSLITGRYVHTDGHRTLWNLIKPWENNLFGYLKDAGYHVRIYGKNDMFSADAVTAFTDVFELKRGEGEDTARPLRAFGQSGYYDFLYGPMEGEYTDHGDYRNVRAGIDFIRSRKPGDAPFILFLPLRFPHCPYTAHEPFYSMYGPGQTPALRPEGRGKPLYHNLIRRYRDLSGTEFDKVNAVYQGMVSFADVLLGELMDGIDEAGIGGETMLIASSDHGDYAGDYGLVEKWPSGCEDVLTRVPLLIRAPGCKAGARSAEPVELFDVMPTILETAGITPSHTHFARSLTPQLGGAPGDAQRAVFCEGGYNMNEPHCNEGTPLPSRTFMESAREIYYPKGLQQREWPTSVGRATMMRTLTHKLVLRTYGDHEMYDLVSDALELNNVYHDAHYAHTRAEMERGMLDWYIATSDCAPYQEDKRGL